MSENGNINILNSENWKFSTITWNNMRLDIKINQDTGDYCIIAPTIVIEECKKIYGEGFAGLTFGEFIYRMVINGTES